MQSVYACAHAQSMQGGVKARTSMMSHLALGLAEPLTCCLYRMQSEQKRMAHEAELRKYHYTFRHMFKACISMYQAADMLSIPCAV